jgi:hypothetical protein
LAALAAAWHAHSRHHHGGGGVTGAVRHDQVQLLEYGIRKPQRVVLCLLTFAVFGGWSLIFPELLLTLINPRPLDYASFALPVSMLLAAYLLAMPFLLWWMSRQKTVLRPDGVLTNRALIYWPYVVGISPVWQGLNRGVALVLADGRKVHLRAPIDLRLWGVSPRFEALLAEIRQYALRRGARVDAQAPRRRFAVAIYGAMAAVVLLGAVYLLFSRPVVTPWTPTAAAIPDACVALEKAGLQRHWPRATRERDSNQTDSYPMYDEAECSWDRPVDSETEAPYDGVGVTITNYHTRLYGSGVAEAMDDYASDLEYVDESPMALPGAEEAAFHLDGETVLTILARRGDVIIELTLDRNSDAATTPARARQVAADLATGVLTQIRMG